MTSTISVFQFDKPINKYMKYSVVGERADNDHVKETDTQRAHRAPALKERLEPKDYLIGWPAIMSALGRKDTSKVKRMNQEYGGPIVIVGQGHQPFVTREKLLSWWNGLEDMYEKWAARNRDRERDRTETVKDTHQYGRTGTVVPDIGGCEKRRRRRSG